MSFSDTSTYGNWRYIGCFLLGFLLSIFNLLALAMWYLTIWDVSTDTYRPLTFWDILPLGIPIVSAAILALCVRWATRNRI